MIAVLPWLLVVEALALAALPLTMRVFRGYPDRGFGVGRVLGLVLVGVACWLTGLLGLTSYRPSTAVLAALILAAVAWSLWGGECRAVVRARWRLLLALEATFLVPLTVGLVVRAYNADIIGQEKFMDMAFMNALLRTTVLPAEDMWLSGNAMPYYYLSYLLAGLPAKVAGTHPPVAYNLAMAFVFAAGFAAATSIVYALLAGQPRAARLRESDNSPDAVGQADADAAPAGQHCRRAFVFALIGGVLVMVAGNLVGPLELLAAAGWGSPGFWEAVGVKGLAANPSGGLLPADGGWWWRSSRVIPNIPPDGITEFPYFSFILGDLHPHYVAIVLDLLIVALALDPWLGEERPIDWVRTGVTATVMAALVAASTWDVPTFWGLFVLAGALDAWRRHRDSEQLRARLPALLLPVACALGLVVPYFVGYQSQRLGLGLVEERTPVVSILILFGPALAAATLLGVWLLRRPLPATVGDAALPAARPADEGLAVERSVEKSAVAAVAVAGGSRQPGAEARVAVAEPPADPVSDVSLAPDAARPPAAAHAADAAHPTVSTNLDDSGHLGRTAHADDEDHRSGGIRAAPGGLGLIGLAMLAFSAFGEPTLALLVSLAILLAWAGWRFLAPGHGPVTAMAGPTLFIWLLAGYAIVVLIGVELIFLRDLFGTRMNTVFKFHYHAWLMLGVATAATVGTLWDRGTTPGRADRAVPAPAWRYAAGGLIALALAGGLVYPLAATWTKSGEFRGQPTLDGERFLERTSPADHRAIEWLRATVPGRPVVVEAVGGSYQEFARVSTFSGLPTIIGWPGHEAQWRGERPDYGQRERDVDLLYRSESREEIFRVARQYNARYLFFGSLERNKYGPEAQARLDSRLPIAFNRGGTTVYHLTERGEAQP